MMYGNPDHLEKVETTKQEFIFRHFWLILPITSFCMAYISVNKDIFLDGKSLHHEHFQKINCPIASCPFDHMVIYLLFIQVTFLSYHRIKVRLN